MADPAAAAARNAGDPDDEKRADLGRIETMLRAANSGAWPKGMARAFEAEAPRLRLVFDSTPDAMVIRNADGIDVFWLSPDMEGHPDAIALGELLAAAPEMLWELVDELRRRRPAGAVE